jgi:hypothetical protein
MGPKMAKVFQCLRLFSPTNHLGFTGRRASAGPGKGIEADPAAGSIGTLRQIQSYRLQIAVVLALTVYVGVGIYGELTLCRQKPIPSYCLLEDFNYYRYALVNALNGKDPYEIRIIGPAYLYPPPALLVIELFHHISDIYVLAAVYAAVNIALVALMVYGIAKYYGHGWDHIWYWFPLALGFYPFFVVLHLGQINVITEFGIFLTFLAETAFPVVAGAGLAVAICTKVTPVAFLGYYLVNKRQKAIAATLIALGLLCVITWVRYGWAPFPTYVRCFPNMLHAFYPGPASQSLVARLGVQDVEAAQRFIMACFTAVMVISGVCSFITKEREPLFIIVCLATMLSPNIIWYHHFVFFLLPLLLWMAWSNLSTPVVLWCCGGFALIQAIGVNPQPEAGIYVHAFGHASILLLLLWQIYRVWGRFGVGKGGQGDVTALASEKGHTRP